MSASTALARNRWILSHCTRLLLGSLNPAGSLARLLAEFPGLPHAFCDREREDASAAPAENPAASAPP